MTKLEREVRAVKDRLGLIRTAEELGVSPNTILRVLEGERVHPGTLALIGKNLPAAKAAPIHRPKRESA